MSIDLGIGALETIVKDGIKGLLQKFCGLVVARQKKRGWFKAAKEAVLGYQKSLIEDFLPVLHVDFKESVVVKFTSGKMSKEDVSKLQKFMEMLEKSDFKKFEETLLKIIEDLKVSEWNEELNEKLEEMRRAVAEGHRWIFSRLELHVKSVVKDEMYWRTEQRSKIKVMVYNFTDKNLDESLNQLFENGMDSVPSSRMTKQETDTRVQEALLEFLTRLSRRRIFGYDIVQASNVQDWIAKMKKKSLNREAAEFVERLESTIPALQAELDLLYHEVKLDTKDEMVKKLEADDRVLVMCDKNMGMSLFTLETMRKADEELIGQLGASRMEITKDEIIRKVSSDIDEFEASLTSVQREFMNTVYGGRFEDRKNVKFPFLRSQHKIHKMTAESIKNKDLSSLKFRPVVDAKQWLTRGYSGLVMQMIRMACNKVTKNGGDVFKNIKSKGGWREAVEIREYAVQDNFDISVTADIQEAYTNINDVMINNAVRTVCGFLEVDEWKIDLMTKLVDLVLDQNFVETSVGLFKFRKVLPMGYKISGEALHIVALADEMVALYNVGRKECNDANLGIGELRSYPSEFVDNNVQREVNMTKGVKKVRRYVDDTHAHIAGTIEEVQDGILGIGHMYPESLVVSMNLNIWNSTHLDIFMWKNLMNGTFSTVMKKNADAPVGHVRRGSSHPEKYKLQSLLGEMLRGRRIASDDELIEHSDKCIAQEFESIGYSRWEVHDAMVKAKARVEEKYSQVFVKIPEDDSDERRFFKYGGGIIYNKNYSYGEVFMNYIENIKPNDEPGVIFLPDVKLKRLAYTKKRYLARQEVDIEKKSKQ